MVIKHRANLFIKAFIILLVIIFCFPGCDLLTDSSSTKNTSSSYKSRNTNNTSSARSSSSQPSQKIYSIGDSATIDDLQITILSYEFSEYIGALEGLNRVKDGLSYCVVHATVKNIGKKTVDLTDGLFSNSNYTDKLYYDSDYEYNSTWLDNYLDFFHSNESIPALGEIECCFCYKVASEVEEQEEKTLVFVFQENKQSTTKIIKWKLR